MSDALAPVFIDYGSETRLDDGELAAARDGEYLDLPLGWDVTHGYRTTMTVSFTDPAALPFPAGMIVGRDDVPGIAVLATADLPMVYLSLERGAERCSMEVAGTTTDLSRVWAKTIVDEVEMSRMTAASAGVGGQTVVIDRGGSLVRVTYDVDRAATGTDDDLTYMARAVDGARRFLADVAP